MSITRMAAAQAVAQLTGFSAVIDARSEDEYALDHLPGAVNWPTLNNEERRIVGTTYKQISTFEARKRGAAMAARNIALHIERDVLQVPRDWRPLVYCWRGGSRSGALALILDQIGLQVTLVEGGYKAFRAAVVAQTPELVAPLALRVVCGPTGSGKTRLLQALAAQDAQVLDLEDLASHRASVLGALPDRVQPSQKRFETLVWQRLRGFDPSRPVFVESESKKVGNLAVPEALMQAMRAGRCLHLSLPQPARVALLLEDYDFLLRDADFLCQRLDVLRELRGKALVQAWQDLVRAGRFAELVQALLQQHYDPGYQQSMVRNFAGYATAPCYDAPDGGAATLEQVARRILADADAETGADAAAS